MSCSRSYASARTRPISAEIFFPDRLKSFRVSSPAARSAFSCASSSACFARCSPPIAAAIASARRGSSKSLPIAFMPSSAARSRSVLGAMARLFTRIPSGPRGWPPAQLPDAGRSTSRASADRPAAGSCARGSRAPDRPARRRWPAAAASRTRHKAPRRCSRDRAPPARPHPRDRRASPAGPGEAAPARRSRWAAARPAGSPLRRPLVRSPRSPPSRPDRAPARRRPPRTTPVRETSLTAEDFADRREQAARLLLASQCLPLRGDATALGLFLPGDLERLGRVLRRQRELAHLAAGALDRHVQQALLVEHEVHALPRHLRRKLEGAEVLVVNDAVAVALEDVELEPPAVARRRQAEAALRRDLGILLDHLAEAPAGHGEPDRHAQGVDQRDRVDLLHRLREQPGAQGHRLRPVDRLARRLSEELVRLALH